MQSQLNQREVTLLQNRLQRLRTEERSILSLKKAERFHLPDVQRSIATLKNWLR
jgi:hypothetical protein